jgi:hypothetical protein
MVSWNPNLTSGLALHYHGNLTWLVWRIWVENQLLILVLAFALWLRLRALLGGWGGLLIGETEEDFV